MGIMQHVDETMIFPKTHMIDKFDERFFLLNIYNETRLQNNVFYK